MWLIYSFVLLSEFDIKQMQVREGRQRILALLRSGMLRRMPSPFPKTKLKKTLNKNVKTVLQTLPSRSSFYSYQIDWIRQTEAMCPEFSQPIP